VLEKASQAYLGEAIEKPALSPQAVEAFIRHAQTQLQPSQPTGAER
jgi:streptomycin 3"-adenylyltransferase